METDMLKCIFKSIIHLSMISSLAISVSAIEKNDTDIKINADAIVLMGQSNSGVKGEKAFVDSVAEGHLNVRASKGPFSLFYQLESREEIDKAGNAAPNNQEFKDAVLRLIYSADRFNFVMGTVTHPAVVPYGVAGGTGTSQAPNNPGNLIGYAGYAEDEGLLASFNIMPNMSGALTIYDKAAIGSTKVENGRLIQLGIKGQIDTIGIRAIYSTEDKNNYSDAKPDKTSNSAIGLGVKLGLGAMSVSLDYSALKQKVSSKDVDKIATAVQFRMNNLGPGNLIFTYDMEKISAPKSLIGAAGVDIKENNIINLVYDIPVIEDCGIKIMYLANSSKWSSDEKKADSSLKDTTSSFVGAGLYATF